MILKLAITVVALQASFILTASPVMAQRSNFQAWSQLTTQFAIGHERKWLFYLEAQPRFSDNSSRFDRFFIRPAFGYNYDKDINFYLGYAWTPRYLDNSYQSDFRNENRIWQHLVVRKAALGINWVHGLRQEQRLFAGVSAVSNRFSYQLRGSYKMSESQDFGLTAFQILFLNLNSVENGPRAGFDRARAFFGPYLTIKSARYEVGYLGEYGKRFGNEDRMINALMLSAIFNF